MIPCLTKHISSCRNNRGFTLLELMMAVGFSIFLMTGIYGFYNAASQAYNAGISSQTLQDGANILISRIIQGKAESNIQATEVFRLETSVSYMIPNGSTTQMYSCGGAPQGFSCNANNPYSEIYFCQDSPCTGVTDSTARWYYLDSTGTLVKYHHPATLGGSPIEETIYTAPDQSTINLRFSPASVTYPSNVVEIDVTLVQNSTTQTTDPRLAISASSTYVLLRNHP